VLSHDNESVQERVVALEKKVQLQDDEIICLKSALSDALRRIVILESGNHTCFVQSLSVHTKYRNFKGGEGFKL